MICDRKRTPKDFVNEMLAKKMSWMGVLAVARCVRGGTWREEARRILTERKLMPATQAEMDKAREEAKKNLEEVLREREKKANRKKIAGK